MDKSNVFKSSSFHMDIGDRLHMIIKNESGATVKWMLIGEDEGTGVIPNAPLVSEATDVTASSFSANWSFIENSTGYYLDVARDEDFISFVTGFENKDVGAVITYSITGLDPLSSYYYRIRAYNDIGTSVDSEVVTTQTLDLPALQDLKDIDGNVYTTVIIGNQEWIVENLKTTKYADGSSLPNLVDNNFSDWFLPSKDELNLMYTELRLYGIGGFSGVSYWSSSEYSFQSVWYQHFGTGAQGFTVKDSIISVRTCRSFTSNTNYNLRDIGPSGGYVFWKSGNNYLECSELDQSFATQTWSNITDVAIGTTGTAIGTGQANTNAIIAQAGHVNSAAKLCDDLIAGGWAGDINGAYCWYDNDVSYKTTYGALYNWYAITNEKGLAYFERGGVQETGWRIPTLSDWNALITNISSGHLKEIGTSHWYPTNVGATDHYGFKALPGGYRDSSGFGGINTIACFGSSTTDGSTYDNIIIFGNSAEFGTAGSSLTRGSSIRCVKYPLDSLTVDSISIRVDNTIRTVDSI